jgi:hypothetical protein
LATGTRPRRTPPDFPEERALLVTDRNHVGEQVLLLASRGCVGMAAALNKYAVENNWIDQASFGASQTRILGFGPDRMPHGHQVLGTFLDSVISSLHFAPQTDRAAAREAFRQAVRWIEIETSSQCNRRCSYCPNSKFDRIRHNDFLDLDVYRKMIRELAEIDYDGDIKFVGNNEFFMHKQNRTYVEIARAHLPRVKMTLFSNGDYLAKDDLEWAASAGVGLLIVTLHPGPTKQYDDVEVMRRVHLFQKQIESPLTLRHFQQGVDLQFLTRVGQLTVLAGLTDLAKLGHNWTALLPGDESFVRRDPCTYPLRQFVVNYAGDIFMCCIAFKDRTPENDKIGAITGNLSGHESIFQAYASPNLVAWRRSLFNNEVKADPCRTCIGHADYREGGSKALADFTCKQLAAVV